MQILLIHSVKAEPQWIEQFDCFGMVVLAQDSHDGPVYQDLVTSDDEDQLWKVVRWCKANLAPYKFEWPDDETTEDGEELIGIKHDA